MSQANDRLNTLQSELNSTINRITRPTGRVVGELAALCDDVDDLVDLIDSAEDMSAALRQSSEKLRSILDGVDALRVLLDEYEPTLQEGIAGVGSLSTSAVSALRDLETLLADSVAAMARAVWRRVADSPRRAWRVPLSSWLPELFISASESASRVSRSRRAETAEVLREPTLAIPS